MNRIFREGPSRWWPTILYHKSECGIAKMLLAAKPGFSKAEFNLMGRALVRSSPPRISKIVRRIIRFPVPKPTILDEKKCSSCLTSSERRQFIFVYNSIIFSGQSHLLHPERHEELVDRVSKLVKNTDVSLLAHRMSIFYKEGEDGLYISELNLQSRSVSNLFQKCLKPFPDEFVTKIDPQDLSFLDPCDAKYIALSFNWKGGSLDILQKRYEKETYRCFSTILAYITALAHGNLGTLKFYHFSKKRESLKDEFTHIQTVELPEVKRRHELSKVIAGLTVKDFERGNFNFVVWDWERQMLAKAYKEVERLNAWKSFDQQMPCPEIIDAFYEIGIDSGLSMKWIIDEMRMIHKFGWETVVKNSIASTRKKLGIIDRMTSEKVIEIVCKNKV